MRKEIAEMTDTEIRQGFANGQLTDCDECGATVFNNENCPNPNCSDHTQAIEVAHGSAAYCQFERVPGGMVQHQYRADGTRSLSGFVRTFSL